MGNGAGYELKYLVPTASGEAKEHKISTGDFAEFRGAIQMCKKLGHKLVINQMCKQCARLGCDCNGEANHVYTGCVYRRVS